MMEKVQKIHNVAKGFTRAQKISYVIGALYMLIGGTFCYYANQIAVSQGTTLLWQWVMPQKSVAVTARDVVTAISEDIGNVFNPVKLLYAAVPHYKSKSVGAGLYNQEVAGYFGITKEDELITLDQDNTYQPTFPTLKKQSMDEEKLDDLAYVKSTFYMGGDGKITIGDNLLQQWDFKALANAPFGIDDTIEGPKVLIFHTHSKEKFVGEDELDVSDPGILAVGEALAETLEQKYGIETMHVTESFYMNETSLIVTGQYERMEPVIKKIIAENPSLQVSIDIHRDGVNEGVHLVGDYKGKDAAKIMFVNGLCQTTDAEGANVPMKTLSNPYLDESMAFSLQMQTQMMTYYPELTRKIYLKAYRYSLHMLPQSLLIEWGAQTNTMDEALRSVEPVAHALAKVLEKD